MRNTYLIALLITLIGAGTYWYQSSALLCPAPLSYRLGEINPSFNLSPEQALAYVSQAEALWEKRTGRELFTYDETSDFTIGFVFDERQESANLEETQKKLLDTKKVENDKVLQTVVSLQEDFKTLSANYGRRVADYEKRLLDYNTDVRQHNDRGGAPEDVFESLENERQTLNKEAEELSVVVAELNDLAANINHLSDRGNELVSDYNQGVNQYNNKVGFLGEFTQGDYQGDRIHVYKFSSEEEVVKVLAHEFGHALGVGHVDDESSLMYYLLEDVNESPAISSADLVAYQLVCGLSESFGQKVRRIIRGVLVKIN